MANPFLNIPDYEANITALNAEEKKNKLTDIAEAKKSILNWKNYNIDPSKIDDADTIDLPIGENNAFIPTRGTSPIEGVAYDASEVFHKKGEHSASRSKLDSHRAAYALKNAVPFDTVTDEMVFSEGNRVKAKALGLLRQGAKDPNNFDIEAKVHGTGFFGRLLTEYRNPNTGVNITDALNTPEDNAGYYARYNKNKVTADKLAKTIEELRKYNKNGKYVSDKELENTLSGKLINTSQRAIAGTAEFIGGAIKPIASYVHRLTDGKDGYNAEDEFTYKSLKNQQAYHTKLRTEIEQIQKQPTSIKKSLKLQELKQEIKDTPLNEREEALLATSSNPNGKLAALEQKAKFDNTVIHTIDSIIESNQDRVNKSGKEKFEKGVKGNVGDARSRIIDGLYAVDKGDYWDAAKNFSQSLIDTGEIFVDAIKDDPWETLGLAADSAAMMASMMLAPISTMTSLTATNADKAVNTHKEKYRTDPSAGELAQITLLSAGGAFLERLEALALTGKIPHTTVAAMASKLTADPKLLPKLMATAQFSVNNRLSRTAIIEGATEEFQSATEDLASSVKNPNIDQNKGILSAASGFAAGGATTVAFDAANIGRVVAKAIPPAISKSTGYIKEQARKQKEQRANQTTTTTVPPVTEGDVTQHKPEEVITETVPEYTKFSEFNLEDDYKSGLNIYANQELSAENKLEGISAKRDSLMEKITQEQNETRQQQLFKKFEDLDTKSGELTQQVRDNLLSNTEETISKEDLDKVIGSLAADPYIEPDKLTSEIARVKEAVKGTEHEEVYTKIADFLSTEGTELKAHEKRYAGQKGRTFLNPIINKIMGNTVTNIPIGEGKTRKERGLLKIVNDTIIAATKGNTRALEFNSRDIGKLYRKQSSKLKNMLAAKKELETRRAKYEVGSAEYTALNKINLNEIIPNAKGFYQASKSSDNFIAELDRSVRTIERTQTNLNNLVQSLTTKPTDTTQETEQTGQPKKVIGENVTNFVNLTSKTEESKATSFAALNNASIDELNNLENLYTSMLEAIEAGNKVDGQKYSNTFSETFLLILNKQLKADDNTNQEEILEEVEKEINKLFKKDLNTKDESILGREHTNDLSTDLHTATTAKELIKRLLNPTNKNDALPKGVQSILEDIFDFVNDDTKVVHLVSQNKLEPLKKLYGENFTQEELVEKAKDLKGVYVPATNTIGIKHIAPKKYKNLAELASHELIHAVADKLLGDLVTKSKISPEQNQILKDIENAGDAFIEAYKGNSEKNASLKHFSDTLARVKDQGKSNTINGYNIAYLHEILAYGLTNKQTMIGLDNIIVEDESLLDKFLQTISKLFGFSTGQATEFNRLIRGFNGLLNTSSKVSKRAKTSQSKTTPNATITELKEGNIEGIFKDIYDFNTKPLKNINVRTPINILEKNGKQTTGYILETAEEAYNDITERIKQLETYKRCIR